MVQDLTDIDMGVLAKVDEVNQRDGECPLSTIRQGVVGVDASGSASYRYNKLEDEGFIETKKVLNEEQEQLIRVATITSKGETMLQDYDSHPADVPAGYEEDGEASSEAVAELRERVEELEDEVDDLETDLEESEKFYTWLLVEYTDMENLGDEYKEWTETR